MSDKPQAGGGPPSFTQQLQVSNVTARVPKKVARGVFCSSLLVLQWPTEFVLDFIQAASHPHQLAARVVVPPPFIPRLIDNLRDHLEHYHKTWGALAPAPQRPGLGSIEEIYDGLKIADEALVGVYANAMHVLHTPAEFCFDFIASCYPRAVVTARVFTSATQVPVMLNTLTQVWQTHEAKLRGEPPKPPPG